MFYAHFVLSKRGPLAKIWLAAHWEKKLTKAQVYETNIDSTVDAILEPKVKLALRTSGHLLLGVVRIYSRKAKYLLADCNEAFVKIKMAFRPGVVDLPEDNREAAVSAITLQENFDDFSANFNDFEMDAMDLPAKFAVNQSRPEEITIKEDVGHVNFITDDGFGDVGFDEPEILREASAIEDSLFTTPAPIGDASSIAAADASKNDALAADLMQNDGFGDEGLDADFMGQGLFEDVPVEPPDVSRIEPPSERKGTEVDNSVQDTSIQPSSSVADLGDLTGASLIKPSSMRPNLTDTTILTNEEEAFALEPLDTTSMISGMSTTDRRPKRRRKLLVDEQKGIDSQSMKEQLVQTNDIVTTLDLAPPTRKLMLWKESGAVEKLFTAPARNLMNRRLVKLFTRNLSIVISPEIEEDRSSHAARERSPEHERLPDDPEFVLPPVPMLPAPGAEYSAHDSTLVLEETISAMPPFTDEADQTEEAPRKRRRTDRQSSRPQASEEENSSEPEDGDAPPPSIQESTMMAEESTGDDVEDKRLNRRTTAMLHQLSTVFDKNEFASLLDIVQRNHSRKQVAAKFYTCLVLRKHGMIDLKQDAPYEDILIMKGPHFQRSG